MIFERDNTVLLLEGKHTVYMHKYEWRSGFDWLASDISRWNHLSRIDMHKHSNA